MAVELPGRPHQIVDLAKHLCEISRTAYLKYPRKSRVLGGYDVDLFAGKCFTGFVASDDECVIVAFCGTAVRMETLDELVASVKRWLADLDFAQVLKENYRVHQGWDRELDSVYDDILTLVRDHGGDWKKLYVTGHSAGGALGTLAARRLTEDGVPVNAACVFSAPRAGDIQFRDTFPVPVFRFEYKDDIVPHLPPPPLIMFGIDSLVKRFYPVIEALAPNLMRYAPKSLEYVHVGRLLFIDWQDDLLHSWHFGDPTSLPGQPMPGFLMDPARLARTGANTLEFLGRDDFGFLKHHYLDGFRDHLRRLI